MECKIEFDSLGLKYKECFNKSLTVVFEIAFVWKMFNDLSIGLPYSNYFKVA